MWYTILCNFFKTESFWNTSVPLLIFSVLWDKKVSRKSRDLPLLALKTFEKRKVLKIERFPCEIFRYCEKINFRQNGDTPSYAIFLIQNFYETQGSPYEVFRYCETKKFREKVVISHFYPKNFSIKEIFWKMKGSLKKIFGTVRKPIFDKMVIHHLMQFFEPRIFMKHKDPPTKFSGTVRQKSFERKSWYPPPIHKLFR